MNIILACLLGCQQTNNNSVKKESENQASTTQSDIELALISNSQNNVFDKSFFDHLKYIEFPVKHKQVTNIEELEMICNLFIQESLQEVTDSVDKSEKQEKIETTKMVIVRFVYSNQDSIDILWDGWGNLVCNNRRYEETDKEVKTQMNKMIDKYYDVRVKSICP